MIKKNVLVYLAFLICTQCSHFSKKNYNSIVFTEYGSGAYTDQSVTSYKEILKSVDLKTVSFLFTCHTSHKLSDTIDCESNDSPSQVKVFQHLSDLKKQGYQTTLRVYVDLLSGDWRAYWDPKDKPQAFKNLKSKLVMLAQKAQEIEVDLFIIGAEYEKLTQPQYKNQWVSIIKEIRKVYSGQLTYGANTNFTTYPMVELHWVPFWPELDYIGIDYYHPMSDAPIDLEDFKRQHKKKWSQLTDPLRKLKKSFFINEIGSPIAEKGFLKPYEWTWPKDTPINLEHQMIYLKSFFLSMDADLRGLQIWRYMPFEEKTFKQGYLIDHPKTLEFLKQSFNSMSF